MTWTKLIVSIALSAALALALADAAKADQVPASGSGAPDPVYQIDNGNCRRNLQQHDRNRDHPQPSRDNWVGNVFTATADANLLQSISFEAGDILNSSTLPSAFVTAALYLALPGRA